MELSGCLGAVDGSAAVGDRVGDVDVRGGARQQQKAETEQASDDDRKAV